AIEEEAGAYIRTIEQKGGSVAAIGFMQREIQDAAYRWQREVEDKTRIIVGVNEFVTDEVPPANLFQVDAGVGEALRERVARVRKTRDAAVAARALADLERAARGRENVVTRLVEAVEAAVTLGGSCGRWRDGFARRPP